MPVWKDLLPENDEYFKKHPSTAKVTKFELPTHLKITARFEKNLMIEVKELDTVQAAKELLDDGLNPVILNMANRHLPAAGCMRGNTQEENLFGRSNMMNYHLPAFYPLNLSRGEGIYLSKAVFIRDPIGKLLPERDHVKVSSISMAYPDLNSEKYNEEVAETLMISLLYQAQQLGHDSVVLGAWGCGAFRHNPVVVSNLFKKIINKYFQKSFKKLVFAITGSKKNLHAFQTGLGSRV